MAMDYSYEKWDRKRLLTESVPIILSPSQLARVGVERTRQTGDDRVEVYDYRPEADSYRCFYSLRLVDG